MVTSLPRPWPWKREKAVTTHTSDHRHCCSFLDTHHCCGHPLDRLRMIDDSKKDIDHLQPEMVDVRADTGVLAVHRP